MHLQFVFPQFCFCCSESVARRFPNPRFRNSLVHLNSAIRVTYCMSSCWLCSLNSFTATERVIAHAHQVGNVKLSCWTTTNHMIVYLKWAWVSFFRWMCFRLCVLEEWNFARIIASKLCVKIDIFFVHGSCCEWYPWEEKSITVGIVIFCIHARNRMAFDARQYVLFQRLLRWTWWTISLSFPTSVTLCSNILNCSASSVSLMPCCV